MKYEFLTQSPGISEDETIGYRISNIISESGCNRIFVAAAYATVAGVRNILWSMEKSDVNFKSKWLLGIDDYFTQPGALSLCKNLRDSELRVASFANVGSKFHPKLILFSSSNSDNRNALLLGSSNMTVSGLERNAEACIINYSDSPTDGRALLGIWKYFWRLGKKLTEKALVSYTLEYKKRVKKLRKYGLVEDDGEETKAGQKEILNKDEAEIDPTHASICWIEVGKNTALGRELEFKAEQALFFGLSPHGGEPEFRNFEVSDGSKIPLRLKYQQNAMWRLQMNSNVPEVARGLRPTLRGGKLGRSPYVTVFERTNKGTFKLRFIKKKSSSFKRLCLKSKEAHTLGQTLARMYGWF